MAGVRLGEAESSRTWKKSPGDRVDRRCSKTW